MRCLTQPAKICHGLAKHRRKCTHRHSNFKFEWYRAFINRFFWAQRNCEHHFLTNSCNYKDQGLSNENPKTASAVSTNQLGFVTVWRRMHENARIATQTLNLSGIVHISRGSSEHLHMTSAHELSMALRIHAIIHRPGSFAYPQLILGVLTHAQSEFFLRLFLPFSSNLSPALLVDPSKVQCESSCTPQSPSFANPKNEPHCSTLADSHHAKALTLVAA